MTAFLVILVLFAAFGAASALGWTVDSRDPEFSLGRVLTRQPKPAGTGTQPVVSARGMRP